MIIALIPARYQSSRLPGKPLLEFGKFNMIQRVYMQTIRSTYVDKVYVLTDDSRIEKCIHDIQGNVLMVQEECLNGTERICLALNKYKDLFDNVEYIVNVQGDEPFIRPNQIDIAISKMLENKNNFNKPVCSTLHFKIEDPEMLDDPSIGKLVLDINSNIIYCSRTAIPSNKNKKYKIKNGKLELPYYGHIGLFVFNLEYLKDIFMKDNYPLQLEEDIEWLKIIEQGYNICSTCVNDYEIGVNTLNDYNYLLDKYINNKKIENF